jgi:hypothetical protein
MWKNLFLFAASGFISASVTYFNIQAQGCNAVLGPKAEFVFPDRCRTPNITAWVRHYGLSRSEFEESLLLIGTKITEVEPNKIQFTASSALANSVQDEIGYKYFRIESR